MSQYWDFLNHEPDITRGSYTDLLEVYDLAIFAWESYITPHYFSDFDELSIISVMYKSQADISLKQGLNSILRKEYAQAIYNIRFAIENLVIAIFAYAKPNEAVAIMKKKETVDAVMKKAARTYLESTLPKRSKSFKDVKVMCNKFGSHQTLAHHARSFKPGEDGKSFNLAFQGADSLELNVGLTGIIVGSILEFHFSIAAIGDVEWVKVQSNVQKDMSDIEKQLTAMKQKYMYLYANLFSV